MHIARQTPTELVVEDSSLWISYLCAGAGFLLLVLSIAQHQPKGFLAAAFFLLSGAIFERKTTFTFDLLEPLDEPTRRKIRDKKERHRIQCERALAAFDAWWANLGYGRRERSPALAVQLVS